MDLQSEENYLINKAKEAQPNDPFTAKAWILAGKTLFPNNFSIQFEAYAQERAANNYMEAAKCFSYIVLTFTSQPAELWTEVNQLTAALRIPEGQTTPEQEFYVKMFQHIPYDVQFKILVNLNSDNNLNHCQFILLLLKRFPHAIPSHSPRLIDMLVQGTKTNQPQFTKLLILEALPLIIRQPPDLPSHLMQNILNLVLEYYIAQMFLIDVPPSVVVGSEETTTLTINECWQRIFEVLDLCARSLKWDPFLSYNKNWSKDVYWQKFIQIVSNASARPKESKQILYYGTILFVMSLQHYVKNVTQKIDDAEVDFVLLEGFKDISDSKLTGDPILEPPHITVNQPCGKDVPICFVTAAQCWTLLHSNEMLQMDFTHLLRSLPCSKWVNRFLIDLAFYTGRPEEAQTILKDTVLSNTDKNMRMLSLALQQSKFTVQTFELIVKILSELPGVSGHWMPVLSSNKSGRHLILLPFAKRAILQYCTKMVVNALKSRLISVTNDDILGNLLILLQLDWPTEKGLAESIFEQISNKGQFTFLHFTKYITCTDFIEEFMYIYMHGNDVQLEFTPPQTNSATRRIGTRGADKEVKDDFKQLLKQQVSRSNDSIENLIVQFITQEHAALLANIFDK